MTSIHSSVRRGRRGAALLAPIATIALLTGCGTTTGTNAAGAAAPAQNASQGSAQVPAEVTTLDGAKMTIPAGKPAAVFFFGVGCGECVGGVKSLAQAAKSSAGQADFLIVDLDPSESPETIAQFQRATGAQHVPAAIDTGAALSRRFGVAALSTLIVIDPTGQVSYRATSPSTDQITAALRQAEGAR